MEIVKNLSKLSANTQQLLAILFPSGYEAPPFIPSTKEVCGVHMMVPFRSVRISVMPTYRLIGPLTGRPVRLGKATLKKISLSVRRKLLGQDRKFRSRNFPKNFVHVEP